MLKRTENGKLYIDALGIDIFFGNLFAKCKTIQEVQWLVDQLIGHVDNVAAEREGEL